MEPKGSPVSGVQPSRTNNRRGQQARNQNEEAEEPDEPEEPEEAGLQRGGGPPGPTTGEANKRGQQAKNQGEESEEPKLQRRAASQEQFFYRSINP